MTALNIILAIAVTNQWQAITAVTYIDHIITPQDSNFLLQGSSSDRVVSQDTNTRFLMQSDGNLVLETRPNSGSNVWTNHWASDTWNTGKLASLQWDGNLVVYDDSGGAVYGSTNTWHKGANAPNALVVSNDGYAYIVTRKNQVTWQINTAATITPSLTSLDPDCAFTVLSINHADSSSGRYFNFDASTVDIMLGRTDWTSQNFTIYNLRTSQMQRVIVWRASNGGSVGDAHGRKQPMSAAVNGNWEVNDMLTMIGIDCLTLSPTAAPTSSTDGPTQYTQAPTISTDAPTQYTDAPTLYTTAPTQYTNAPTQYTDAPTLYTTAPTQYTNAPSARTDVPSNTPTGFPSVSPTSNTDQPTSSPTKQPTKQPSVTPTLFPTDSPTRRPSFNPTLGPVREGGVPLDTTQTNVYTSMAAAANVDTQTSNAKFLIIVVLSGILGLMCVLCVFTMVCCWKQHNKKGKSDSEKAIEMNEVNGMDRVMSVSSVMYDTRTNTETNGEGGDGAEVTGNLPPEPTDIDGDQTDSGEQNELFLQNVEPQMQENITAGNGTVGQNEDAFGDDTDTDEDNGGMYGKPEENNATRGM